MGISKDQVLDEEVGSRSKGTWAFVPDGSGMTFFFPTRALMGRVRKAAGRDKGVTWICF